MKSCSCWLIFTIIGLSLTSCSQPKSSQEIAETVNKSLVLIYYEKQGGHGTGFIVPGKKGVCTVLTAGHVVKGYSLKLQTYQDKQGHTADSIQTSPTYDLAVVTFKSAGESCPYSSVNFGNSNELKVGHKIYIYGFPVLQNEDLAPEFLEGSVSRINVVLTEGYGINYTAQVSIGISGAPVLDASGKVVAVHGLAKDKLPRGIPIKTYLENQSNFVNQPIAKADSTKLENKSDVITVIPSIKADSTKPQNKSDVITVIPNIKVDYTKPANKSDVIPIPKVDYTKPEIKSGIVIPKVDYTKPENKSYLVNQPIAKADYTKLEQLLAAGKWQEADKETANKMLEVAGQQKQRWLAGGDIENFSCPDLRAMDRLWVKYSEGHFGFSVQKRIYQSLGGTEVWDDEVRRAWETAIGWREKAVRNEGHDSERTFNTNAPSGHLPGWDKVRVGWGTREVPLFFSHAETCEL